MDNDYRSTCPFGCDGCTTAVNKANCFILVSECPPSITPASSKAKFAMRGSKMNLGHTDMRPIEFFAVAVLSLKRPCNGRVTSKNSVWRLQK